MVYLRFLAADYIETHETQFSPFLPAAQTVASYVASEIMPMGKDCDHLSCLSLPSALGFGVRIAYLGEL